LPQARKRFGQHFLHDPGVIARIVAAIAPRPGQRLVEIGPGRGALTQYLLRACGRLDVIEIDHDLAGALETTASDQPGLTVHLSDALQFQFARLADPGGKLRIVGNLPYNISTPLIFHLLEQAACIQDMVFMLQKEVVDRLAAAPGNRDYGRLSVMVQYRCRAEKLFDVGRGAFHPPPKVTSTVVRLQPFARGATEQIEDERRFADLVRLAFSARRKTLRNALGGTGAESAFAAAGIDPVRRPETLGVEEFVRLCNAISD
jgi:16S rRNA (adenine1518-N6/adenine1519-N6)-dimethyltransferase